MIDIIDLSKIYNMGSSEDSKVYALNHINLHIQEHEFVSIIGPSGSGKSTLMNMLRLFRRSNVWQVFAKWKRSV